MRARAPRRRRAASSGVCPRRRSRNPGERYVTRRYEPGSAAGPSSPAVSRRAGVPGSAFALAADERSDRTPLAPPALPTLSGPETAWCGAETVRTPFPLSARLSPRAHPAGTPSNCVHPSAGAGEHLSARRALLRLSNRTGHTGMLISFLSRHNDSDARAREQRRPSRGPGASTHHNAVRECP